MGTHKAASRHQPRPSQRYVLTRRGIGWFILVIIPAEQSVTGIALLGWCNAGGSYASPFRRLRSSRTEAEEESFEGGTDVAREVEGMMFGLKILILMEIYVCLRGSFKFGDWIRNDIGKFFSQSKIPDRSKFKGLDISQGVWKCVSTTLR